MSDERRLAVEMVWTTTKEFTVTVPADVKDDEIESILWDCEREFEDLDPLDLLPRPADGEETVVITALGLSETELQSADFEEADHG